MLVLLTALGYNWSPSNHPRTALPCVSRYRQICIVVGATQPLVQLSLINTGSQWTNRPIRFARDEWQTRRTTPTRLFHYFDAFIIPIHRTTGENSSSDVTCSPCYRPFFPITGHHVPRFDRSVDADIFRRTLISDKTKFL